MTREPAWLYPSRLLDRSLRARARRAVARRSESLRRRVPPVLRIVREVSEVSTATGRSAFTVGAEVVSAWLRDGIDPRQFAGYMLWDVARAARRDFVRASELDPFFAATTQRADRALMLDKAGFAVHALSCGIPCLPTVAVINRCEGMEVPTAAVAAERAGLFEVLERVTAKGDVVLKPSVGKQGIGVYRVSHGGRVRDADGQDVSMAALTESVFAYRHPAGAYGYIVQPLLDSHPELVELTGVTELSTLRVITAVREGVVHTVRAFLKIAAPGRLTNNFRGGATGSLLTPLDPTSGRLGDLVGILRPENRFAIERTSTHPVTGRRVSGRELPAWRDALDVAHRGALLHPRTATLGWDIVLGPAGWHVLEVNTSWGPGGPQASTCTGLRPELARLFPEHWQ